MGKLVLITYLQNSHKMPGSSPLPVSLPNFRKQYNLRHATARQQLLAQSLDLIRNVLLILFRGYGFVGSLQKLYRDTYKRLYGIFLSLPFVRDRVRADVDKAITDLEGKLVPSGPGTVNYKALPASGWTPEQVRAELEKLGSMEHTRWEDGRVSGAVYHGGLELSDLQAEAFKRFGVSNPIHPDVFPGVRKMEAEVVAMTLGT